MATQSSFNSNQTASQSSFSTPQFASIEIHDAMIKFSLYLQKLHLLQETQSRQNESKCQKLVRLIIESFIKYSETQEFAKQAYEIVKPYIVFKKSYYSLIVMDLMMKNSKYVIKNVSFFLIKIKKQLEPMMKTIWERVATQTDRQLKQSRLQNLKVIIRCWGFIFGDKVEETFRKWLETKYGLKRIELNQENQKALKETYGDKTKESGKNNDKDKLTEALLSSLIDDDNTVGNSSMYLTGNSFYNGPLYNTHNHPAQQIRESTIPSDPRHYRYQTSFGQIASQNNHNQNKPNSANLPNNQPQVNKPKSLEGMNKSLLEALDLS